MIPVLPTDPALPHLNDIFDGKRMRNLIATYLLAGTGVTVAACTPTYVRYKPGTSCLVSYDLTLRNAAGDEWPEHAQVKLFDDDRPRRRAGSKKLHRLADEARADGDHPYEIVAFIPELNGLLQLYPVDYDLKPLVKLSAAASAEKYLHKAGLSKAVRVTSEPERIRYKPGRKAMLRFDVDGMPTQRIYAKLLEDDRVGAIARHTASLIEAGIPTPPVVATNPEIGLIAHPEVPGERLALLRGTNTFTSQMPVVANILHRFGAVPVDAARHTLADEAGRIVETVNLLTRVAPDLTPRLRALGEEITSRLSKMQDTFVTAHGDFYDDQLLVDGDNLTLIDLDEMRLAHPLLDPGNMLAHLRAGTDTGPAHNAFLAAVHQTTGADHDDIMLFEAIGLTKLLPGPFRRLEPGWLARIDILLGHAERSLAAASTPTTPNPAPPVRDPALPQLDTLLDPVAMEERFQAIAPDNENEDGLSSLATIDLVRHKPGRRAILRYTLQSGERLYGKTFASKRGPKVYRITEQVTSAHAFGPDVALPATVAWLPDEKLILQRAVPGAPVEDLLCHGDTWLAREIATALHRFHTSGLDLGRVHDLEKEMSPLPRRAEETAGTVPALRDLAGQVLGRANALARQPFAWRLRPIHRDFYHDQVLVHAGKLAVLDLDDAAMSEPAIDVANFAAHLILLGAQRPKHARALDRVRETFLDRYRALDPALDHRLVDVLIATTLLRISGIHAPRKDGARVARELLDAASAILDTLDQSRNVTRHAS